MTLRLELLIAGDLRPALDGRDDLAELDGVTVRISDQAPAGALTRAAWLDDGFDFWAFDRHLDDLVARGEPLRVATPAVGAAAVAREISTRGQRLAPRRNRATAGAWFDRVLDEHRALHDLGKPLVRADLDHALDAWQWALRLDPEAPCEVQLAVLLHDIERLTTEPCARIEHLAADYQAFKDAHARAGARIARAFLLRAGVPAELADRACALIAVHERRADAPVIRAINDADALSFFSLNSPGYLAYFGAEATTAKVAYTLARMSETARRELPALRMPRLVRTQALGSPHGDHRA
ncbi:MAG TPA: DUF4202 family protein [Kofleriaceae bacterium]